MPEQQRAMTKTISIYPSDWKLIAALAEQHGISQSLALRLIIRQWKNQRSVESAYQRGLLTEAERAQRLREITL